MLINKLNVFWIKLIIVYKFLLNLTYVDCKSIHFRIRCRQWLSRHCTFQKKTVDRLLKKQDTKLLKSSSNNKKTVKAEVLMFSYRNTQDGVTVSVPPGCDFPILPQRTKWEIRHRGVFDNEDHSNLKILQYKS